MNNSVFVSVIIPLYNKEKYIRRTILSILAQSLTNYELIIVDDSSTDGSRSQAETIVDDRILIVSQQNRGPGSARNTGLKHARADFVAFLDADDEWLPDYLKNGVEILASNPDFASVTQGYFLNSVENNTKEYWQNRGLKEGIVKVSSATPVSTVIAVLAYMNPWSTIIRKDVAIKYGGFFDLYKCLYAEDAYLMLNILMNEEIYINLNPQAIYHVEASDLTKIIARPPEIAPFLINPNEIISNCLRSNLPVLRQTLAFRAWQTATLYAKFGDGDVAKSLLLNYKVPGFMQKEWFTACTMAQIAPILPITRKYFRVVRNLIHV